ncbi:MAG: response regulator [Caldanaerobacter sp.]
MVRLLIADDEQIVLDSIEFIIQKNNVQAEIVGKAKSGREAIEKVDLLKPDLVFMDIRMPGIDGIEAIRQIKERHRDIIFVIITAYEYFDYAKEAINLGVIDYLLKPLNKNKVIEVIEKAAMVIEERRKAILKEIELREKINKIIPYLEEQFLYTVLFGGYSLDNLGFYEEIFGMNLKRGYIMIFLISSSLKNEKDNIELNLKRQKLYEHLRTFLKGCILGPLFMDKVCAYFPADGRSSFELKNFSLKIADKVLESLDERERESLRIGVGREYSFNNIVKSYYEAEMALKLSPQEVVVHFDDVMRISAVSTFPYPLDKEKLFIEKLVEGDLARALEIFGEIYEWMIMEYGNDVEKIKSKLIELVGIIKRSFYYYLEEGFFQEEVEYIEEILKIGDVRELKVFFMKMLREMVENIDTINRKKWDGITLKIINFLEENFDKDISLEDVAREVNMSYHYFSKFFKERVGENFIDYLTNLRIKKAMELLKNSGLSIKEVSYKVGYSDPNYFSKIFKKVTGITPTDFREGV